MAAASQSRTTGEYVPGPKLVVTKHWLWGGPGRQSLGSQRTAEWRTGLVHGWLDTVYDEPLDCRLKSVPMALGL